MLFSINTNSNSILAQKNLPRSLSAAQTNVQKLSTGSSINSSSDDAAGLGVSESLKNQSVRRQASGDGSDSLMRTTGAERYRAAMLLQDSGNARDDRYAYESSGVSDSHKGQQKQISGLSQHDSRPHYALRILG